MHPLCGSTPILSGLCSMSYYDILFIFKQLEKQITNFSSLQTQKKKRPPKKILDQKGSVLNNESHPLKTLNNLAYA